MLPAPVVHADFAALVAFAVANEEGAAPLVEVWFGQSERLVDPQPNSALSTPPGGLLLSRVIASGHWAIPWSRSGPGEVSDASYRALGQPAAALGVQPQHR